MEVPLYMTVLMSPNPRYRRRKSSPKTLPAAAPKKPILKSIAQVVAEKPPMLTVDDVAAVLQLSTRTIHTYLNDGLLKRVKLGHKTVRIPRDSVLRFMGDGLLAKRTGDIMTPAPKTVSPDLLASAALELINASSITTLFVVEDGRPIGIIHVHDLLRAGVA